ncbi:MAG: tetraacyldisaccharide 4'-kinase [Arcobacter sp.]|uniref:tetraacyldisaccharide 4'-kinase n=1 Tax=Arcobacter sp. TaxID=1872629 RepID=UPI003B0058A2
MLLKQKLNIWIEEYLFFPTFFQKIISFLFIPFTLVYMLIVSFKRISSKTQDFGIPVISVGNLIVGGSGKTPVTIALAKDKSDYAIVLRGYGRKSKGLFVVSQKTKILVDIETCGDEAMLLAKSLPKATVIVSEDRVEAILKAKELACKLVFLDDGFSKYQINKFDILLRPKKEPENIFCLPSGGYREPKMMYATANMVLKEGVDFTRVVKFKKDGKTLEELPFNIVILTAISKAKRLLDFVPKPCALISFPDHYSFTKLDIEVVEKSYKDFTILTTAKDFVKLEKFNIKNLVLMDLEIEFSKDVDFSNLEKYLKMYKITHD